MLKLRTVHVTVILLCNNRTICKREKILFLHPSAPQNIPKPVGEEEAENLEEN